MSGSRPVSAQVTRLSAYAVCRRDGHVLLVHQVAPGPASGLWTLPGGGIEFGESPAAAVRREVHEETGTDAVVGQVLAVHDNVYDLGDGVTRHGVRLLYAVTLTGQPRVGSGGEIDRVGWHALDALPPDITAWAALAASLPELPHSSSGSGGGKSVSPGMTEQSHPFRQQSLELWQ